jgi:hypothetical protein
MSDEVLIIKLALSNIHHLALLFDLFTAVMRGSASFTAIGILTFTLRTHPAGSLH